MEHSHEIYKEGYTIHKNPAMVGYGKSIQITSNPQKALAFMEKEGITNIYIYNPSHSNIDSELQIKNLDFLLNKDAITGIDVGSFMNISALNTCKNLKHIGLQFPHQEDLDFANLPNLTSLQIVWTYKIKNFELLTNLEYLHLYGYNGKDLSILKHMPKLKEVYIDNASIESLVGIEYLEYLKKITFRKCKKLVSLLGLSETNKSLEFFVVQNSNKLVDISSISTVKSLRYVDFWRVGIQTQNVEDYDVPKGWNLPRIEKFRIVSVSKKKK